MNTALPVRRLDLGDDAQLAAAYAVECPATSAVRPGWIPLGGAPRIAAWRADDGWDRRLFAASNGGERDRGRTPRVRTSSDNANVWMRRINAELGFVPVESEVILHRQR